MEGGFEIRRVGLRGGGPVGARAYSSEGLRDRGIVGVAGGRRTRTITRMRNEERERERSRAEEWPTEYTDDTERPWRGAILSRWRTRNENDFFWGGRAAGAEMAGREPLSRGAGDGGK